MEGGRKGERRFQPSEATLFAWEARSQVLSFKQSKPGSEQANAARANATKAFGKVVELTEDRLFRVARACTRGRRDAAQEILQDSYLKALGSIDRFSADSQVETWLHSIVINQAVDYLRAEVVRNRGLINDGEPIEEFITADLDTADMAERQELHDEIISELRELEIKPRTVMFLYYYLRLDHPEISEILGLKSMGSKVISHRALKLLKERWKH